MRRIILWVRLTLRGEECLVCLSHGVVVEMGYLQAKTRCGEGDVLKSNKWLAMVKIEQVVGCAHEKNPPKTPPLNGLAKRMNRTLIERVRCMLSKAKLPKHF